MRPHGTGPMRAWSSCWLRLSPQKRSTVRPQSIASRATWLVVSEFDVDELYKELDCEATTGPMSLRTLCLADGNVP